MSKVSPYAALAFDALASNLQSTHTHSLVKWQRAIPYELAFRESPLFVTWNTVDEDDGSVELRGCIGTFEKQPIETGIKRYSLIAGLQDPRFSPIKKRELAHLECAVTILSDFERVDDPLGWQIGTHGVQADFYHSNRLYSATFLPDVAVEQEWDQATTLKHLAVKAGIRKYDKVEVTRYKGIKSSIRWSEYKQLEGSLET
jgi:AMME syndrome candidate gene 1 protein